MIREVKGNPDIGNAELLGLSAEAISNVLANESETVRKQAVKNAMPEVTKTIKMLKQVIQKQPRKRINSRYKQAVSEYGILITQTLN
jgi:hypothetical protein